MVHNATITRIDTPLPADAGGAPVYAEGAAVEIPCNAGQLDTRQVRTAEARQLQSSTKVMVMDEDLPAGVALEVNQRLTVRPDGRPAKTYLAEHVEPMSAEGLSHSVVYLIEE